MDSDSAPHHREAQQNLNLLSPGELCLETIPGTLPTDIDTSNVVAIGGCGRPNYIDDGIGEALGLPTCGGGGNVAMKAFDEPGRYLIICQFRPHFESGMWGWVNVN